MTAIYRGMDQETLDLEYNARATVDDFDGLIAQYVARSAQARETLDCREDVSYGEHSDEVVDIFPAGRNSPVFIYIHGGYWRLLSQKESASMAPGMVANGVSLVTVNYSLAPVGKVRGFACRPVCFTRHRKLFSRTSSVFRSYCRSMPTGAGMDL